jgi:hypothetical protein
MSLTHEESRLFAMLWLKAGEDAVLQVEDAREVAVYTAKATEMGLTPCARERLQPFDLRPFARLQARQDQHSSWVH